MNEARPGMMGRYGVAVVVGVFLGMLATMALMWMMAPGLMLREELSPLDLDATVEAIKTKAEGAGWVVSSVMAMEESIRKHGGGDILPVRLVNLCQANHAARILNDDSARRVSVMMPCTIAVYQKGDGKTYIGTMNAGLMGRMFGGTVAEVMGVTVAKEQREFVTLP